MSYSSNEIQDFSSEYRNVARRLSRTDYAQCDANLKRFMAIVQSNPMIIEFIAEKNVKEYDIEEVMKSRDWIGPFEISADICEEISLEYQMLLYSLEHFDGDFTRLYGGIHYTSAKSTINDEMRKFIEHVIDPFIDHISEYLRICYEKAVRDESKSTPTMSGNITANYSTVVVSSDVGGSISTYNDINSDTQKNVVELIAAIKESLMKEKLDERDDILDILNQIEEDVKSLKAPRKGFLTVLKTLCAGCATIVPLVTELLKLFSNV